MTLLRKDFHDLDANGELGDWCFTNDDTYLWLRYPEEGHLRGETISIPIANNPLSNGACWQWDGNHEAPTVTPSIRILGYPQGAPDRWHGFLKSGKLINA